VVNAYFLDSSALVKRYVTETGTSWVQSVTHPSVHNRLIIARLTWVEVLSALARRRREGSLSSEQVTGAINSLRYDLDTYYQVIEVSRALAEAAGQLTIRHPLRAYDAIQLASALHIHPSFAHARLTSLTFAAADDRLLAIAQAEGLRTENPNHHP
jgi:predicted nucleic acid-binding protein